jgi:hypothetical protein
MSWSLLCWKTSCEYACSQVCLHCLSESSVLPLLFGPMSCFQAPEAGNMSCLLLQDMKRCLAASADTAKP